MGKADLSSLLLSTIFGILLLLEAFCRPRDMSGVPSGRRMATNVGLGMAGLLLSGLPALFGVGAGVLADRFGIGLAQRVAMPWVAAFALLLLGRSFVAYWTHRLFHAAPLLWRLHRIHHADAHIDVTTGLRNHPLELLVVVPAAMAVVLLVGAPVSAVLAVDLLLFAAALWQHAELPLPAGMERGMRSWLVTPAFHRTHHLVARSRHDSNYGDVLTLWDRLFGTARPAAAADERVGLDGQWARADNLAEQLLSPFVPDGAGPRVSRAPSGRECRRDAA